MGITDLMQRTECQYASQLNAIKEEALTREHEIKRLSEASQLHSSEVDRIQEKLEALKQHNADMAIKAIEIRKNLRPDHVIANALSNMTGLEHEVLGPFGLQCEGIIALFRKEDADKRCTERAEIDLFYRDGHDVNQMAYWTGETKDRYAPGTLGALNGMNKVYMPLPSTMDELVEAMSGDEQLLRLAKQKIHSYDVTDERLEKLGNAVDSIKDEIERSMATAMSTKLKKQIVDVQGNINGNGNPECWIYFKKGCRLFDGMEADLTWHEDKQLTYGGFLLESDALHDTKSSISYGVCVPLGDETTGIWNKDDTLNLGQMDALAKNISEVFTNKIKAFEKRKTPKKKTSPSR